MSLADELAKLHTLRESGAITEAEYFRAKSQLLDQPAPPVRSAPAAYPPPIQYLAKSSTDRYFGGVCGGLGKYTGMPSWIWRIIFCVGVISFGVGIIPYVLLWIFMPAEDPRLDV